jgi:putative glycosyltransferase
MKLSIVTTMYYSASYLEEFYARVRAAACKITEDFEIIFVNDGSPDNSLEVAISIFNRDERVKIIDLSRNFGHHKAIMTGLAHADGDRIFLLDSDLEEEPELLEQFNKEMDSTQADVVYGVQVRRKGDGLERLSGYFFYPIFNFLSNYPVPTNLLTVRLMSERYVKSLVEYKENEIFLAGLWAITGYKQIPLMVNKAHKGRTTYNVGRKVSILINSITSFSNKPLVIIFYFGSLISVISFFEIMNLLVRRLFFGIQLEGWTSLIVSIWLLGGLTIMSLGVIGVYISKIFMETKRRPYTTIRQIFERGGWKINS